LLIGTICRYDFCVHGRGASPARGATVFEDNFDEWMASGVWDLVYNGVRSFTCGAVDDGGQTIRRAGLLRNESAFVYPPPTAAWFTRFLEAAVTFPPSPGPIPVPTDLTSLNISNSSRDTNHTNVPAKNVSASSLGDFDFGGEGLFKSPSSRDIFTSWKKQYEVSKEFVAASKLHHPAWNHVSRLNEHHPLRAKAMTFSTYKELDDPTNETREMITPYLNLPHGGYVRFMFRYGDLEVNGEMTTCKAQERGLVVLSYRHANLKAANWKDWERVPSVGSGGYRRTQFRLWERQLPQAAWGSHVQIRIQQRSYSEHYEHFAVDDFAVIRFFAPGWSSSTKRLLAVQKHAEAENVAACCLDSPKCPTRAHPKWDPPQPSKLKSERFWVCTPYAQLPGLLGNNLQGSELWVVTAFCLLAIRTLVIVIAYLMAHRLQSPHVAAALDTSSQTLKWLYRSFRLCAVQALGFQGMSDDAAKARARQQMAQILMKGKSPEERQRERQEKFDRLFVHRILQHPRKDKRKGQVKQYNQWDGSVKDAHNQFGGEEAVALFHARSVVLAAEQIQATASGIRQKALGASTQTAALRTGPLHGAIRQNKDSLRLSDVDDNDSEELVLVPDILSSAENQPSFHSPHFLGHKHDFKQEDTKKASLPQKRKKTAKQNPAPNKKSYHHHHEFDMDVDRRFLSFIGLWYLLALGMAFLAAWWSIPRLRPGRMFHVRIQLEKGSVAMAVFEAFKQEHNSIATNGSIVPNFTASNVTHSSVPIDVSTHIYASSPLSKLEQQSLFLASRLLAKPKLSAEEMDLVARETKETFTASQLGASWVPTSGQLSSFNVNFGPYNHDITLSLAGPVIVLAAIITDASAGFYAVVCVFHVQALAMSLAIKRSKSNHKKIGRGRRNPLLPSAMVDTGRNLLWLKPPKVIQGLGCGARKGALGERIDLSRLNEIRSFDVRECRQWVAMHLFGTMPWASLCLLAGPSMPWISLICGAFTIFRGAFGPEWTYPMRALVLHAVAAAAICATQAGVDDLRITWAKSIAGGRKKGEGWSRLLAHSAVVGFWVRWAGTTALFAAIMLRGASGGDKDGHLIVGNVALTGFIGLAAAVILGSAVSILQALPCHNRHWLTMVRQGHMVRYTTVPPLRGPAHRWWQKYYETECWFVCFSSREVAMIAMLKGHPQEEDLAQGGDNSSSDEE